MNQKLLIAVLVLILALAGGGAYLVLRGAPEGPPGPSENVPPGVVTKAGTLEHDETWSGKIFVSGLVVVPENVTLTIEPGTVVKFMYSRDYKNPGKGSLQINGGTLRAMGTPEEPILFTSDADEPINGDWEGIFIGDSKENNVIKYSIVEYAFIGINIWTSSGTVSNSIVRWITAEGIYMERSNPTIENNTIYGTGFNGIAMEQFNENVVIRCNRIENNQGAGIHGEATKATVENNVVANNRFGITFDDYSEVELRYNLVENNSTEGLHLIVMTEADLAFNEIRNNARGITAEGSWLTAHHNDIYNNTEINLEAYSMQQLDMENNWWGTVDGASIGENIQSDQEVPYDPFLTDGVVDIPELVFDYRDVRKTELGYTPGDPEDKYQYVYDNEDETRRVVKKIGENLMFGWSLAWDGEYLWRFTHAGGGDLIKVNPENGEIVARFPNPGIAQDRGMAFDGQHLWINDFTARKVFEVDPTNGEVLSSFDIPEMGSGSSGIAWDGEYLYLVDWLRRDQPGAPLYKVDRQGNLIDNIELEEEGGASITFDGENFWVTPSGKGIRKYNMQGWLVGEIYAAAFGGEAIAHNGKYLWVLHRTQELWKDPKLYQIEILNDAILFENRVGISISDAHAHLFEHDPQFIDQLIGAMDRNGVKKTVLFGSADQTYTDESKYVGGIWDEIDRRVLESYDKYPNRIFPMLSGFNPQNENSVSYLENQLSTGKWKGIGEIYMVHESLLNYKTRADHPVMLQIYRVLARYDALIFFHHERWLQEDVDALYQVMGQNPDVKFVWLHFAHAENPEELENALNTYPNLYVEFEAELEGFSPQDLALFENYPNRFMLGTDIGCVENLETPSHIPYGEAISADRGLLSQLSLTTAERIGYKNLEELMG